MTKLNTQGIPKAILLGKDKRYIQVYHLYRALIIQAFMRRLNASFWQRAETEEDSDGNTWEPLAPATVRYKEGLELTSYKLNSSLSVGLLNLDQRTKYFRAYREALDKEPNKTSPAARRAARKAGWQAIMNDEPEREYASKINVRTGRLVAATQPGTVVGGRYYSPNDQVVKLTSTGGISLEITVPYAEAVDQGQGGEGANVPPRPVIPEESIRQWFIESNDEIIGQVKTLYVNLQHSYASRSSTTKRSGSKRATRRR